LLLQVKLLCPAGNEGRVSAQIRNRPNRYLLTFQETSVKEKILQRGINLQDDLKTELENRLTQLQGKIWKMSEKYISGWWACRSDIF
jgi:hypothetical protein